MEPSISVHLTEISAIGMFNVCAMYNNSTSNALKKYNLIISIRQKIVNYIINFLSICVGTEIQVSTKILIWALTVLESINCMTSWKGK